MALDGVVTIVVGPIGIIVYAIGLAIMAGVWRGILGNRFATIGFWPLLAGLAISAFSTLALSVVQAAMTYRERVQTYPELGGFWSIVPGWAMYFYAVVSACSSSRSCLPLCR